MRHLTACALSLIAALSLPAGAARADERETELRQHFEEGMKLFRDQKYPEASVAFEKFLEMKPEADLVLDLEAKSGLIAFREMLMQKGLKEIALRILRITEMRRKQADADPALIASLVAEIEQVRESDNAENFTAYWDAKSRMVRIGAQAAPALIERLVDHNHDKVRSRVQLTLVEMRGEAVLPLIAAMADSRKMMRQNACIILGQIGDPRATAVLKARLEDADELAEVKSAADEALRKIAKADPATLPRAVACYHRLAEAYHASDPEVVRRAAGADRTIWYYDTQAQKVAGRSVPAYAYQDYMAEQACYEALKIDANYAPVLPTLIVVTFSQMLEVDTLLGIATQRLVAGEGDAADVEALKTRREALQKGKALALSCGKGPLYAALRRALDTNEIPVAVACCDALKDLDDGSWLPTSERDVALTQAWSKSRYAPAEAR